MEETNERTTGLTESVTSLVQILRRLEIINSGMLRLQRCQAVLHSIAEQISKVLELKRRPTVMLEQQILETRSRLVLLDMRLELSDRVARQIQFEHELAHLVVDETGDGLDFQAIGVDDSDVFKVRIRLRVVSKRVTNDGQDELIGSITILTLKLLESLSEVRI